MALLQQSAVTPTSGWAVLTVCGDVDANTAPRLWQYLSYLIGQEHRQLVLDLGGVGLLDTAGVDVLVRARGRLRQEGGELTVQSPNPAAQELLGLVGLVPPTGVGPSTGG